MNLDFKTARRLVMLFMVASVICAIGDIVFIRPGTQASIYVMLLSFLLMALALVMLFVCCRCPWCGRRITVGLMKVEVCPHCRRDIETGMKVKGKNRRKK